METFLCNSYMVYLIVFAQKLTDSKYFWESLRSPFVTFSWRNFNFNGTKYLLNQLAEKAAFYHFQIHVEIWEWWSEKHWRWSVLIYEWPVQSSAIKNLGWRGAGSGWCWRKVVLRSRFKQLIKIVFIFFKLSAQTSNYICGSTMRCRLPEKSLGKQTKFCLSLFLLQWFCSNCGRSVFRGPCEEMSTAIKWFLSRYQIKHPNHRDPSDFYRHQFMYFLSRKDKQNDFSAEFFLDG